jgi:D-sedoheptulose 7-phosphate isomerase
VSIRKVPGGITDGQPDSLAGGINFNESSETIWARCRDRSLRRVVKADMLTTESKYVMARPSGGSTDAAMAETMVADHLQELARLASEHAVKSASATTKAISIIAGSLGSGGKVLACGNGGSAADAQHLVGELIGRVSFERKALAALSLTSDSAVLTAIGNDYGYEEIFARQIHGLGRRGDVLVALSTSGRSKNVVMAVRAARQLGMRIITMTGPSADSTIESADAWVRVESPETTHIQEIHGALVHTMCLGVERTLHRQGSLG